MMDFDGTERAEQLLRQAVHAILDTLATGQWLYTIRRAWESRGPNCPDSFYREPTGECDRVVVEGRDRRNAEYKRGRGAVEPGGIGDEGIDLVGYEISEILYLGDGVAVLEMEQMARADGTFDEDLSRSHNRPHVLLRNVVRVEFIGGGAPGHTFRERQIKGES